MVAAEAQEAAPSEDEVAPLAVEAAQAPEPPEDAAEAPMPPLLEEAAAAERAPMDAAAPPAVAVTAAIAQPTVAAAAPPPEPPEPPDEFLCPITQELMDDPVFATDGHTYERSAIERWLLKKRTSPKTNEELLTTMLFPNHDKRGQVREWKEQHHASAPPPAVSPPTAASPPPLPSVGSGGRTGRGRGRGTGRVHSN